MGGAEPVAGGGGGPPIGSLGGADWVKVRELPAECGKPQNHVLVGNLRGCPGAHLFGNYMLNERRGVTFNFRAAGLKPSLFILPIKSGKRTLK